MNYLLSYGAAGMGDFIATMMFLRDFEEQMPDDKLYLRFEIPYMDVKYADLLKNNPHWHKYDGIQHIDKVIHFGWGERTNEVEQVKYHEDCPYVYTDVIYQAFNSRARTSIKKSRPKADFFFSNDETEAVITTDKPICVVNIGYNIMHGNARNWGWSRFQYIVNALKDYVTFVQVGSSGQGYFHFPLINAVNMIDKSPIRWTLSLLHQARFVITHNSGLLHMAAFDSIIKRKVYCIMGGRDLYKFFNCYDAKNVEFSFVQNNELFTKCFGKDEYCCDAGLAFKTGLNSVGNSKLCKNPACDSYGNIICECFAALNPNIIVESIKQELQ